MGERGGRRSPGQVDGDGDGLDDHLVVEATDRSTRAWLNNGGNQATP
ncbi:hypothetical protein ACIPSE_12545 [Streptomyces sp. NPDC090106]